jgi:hypothetical protein
LQEHIIAEKQTTKQAKMIRKDNYEQKTSVDVIEFHTTEAYSNLGLTKVKYKTYKHSKEEKP